MRALDLLNVDSGLVPLKRNPYYLVVPRYIRTSAGIRVYHLLCHYLNLIGESAFVYIWPHWEGEATNPDLLTPTVNRQIIKHHAFNNLDPIFLFSDTANLNLPQADIVVRLLGHYPNYLAPYLKMADVELQFSYSSLIASRSDSPENVLFMPACDPSIFYPPGENSPRSGTCYYAAKFKDVFNASVFGLPDGCFEIVRDKPWALSQSSLANLFRRSEALYCFEDSAIANEAAMCGCPVILMPNQHFIEPLAINELSWDGYAWGSDASEVDRAKATVSRSFDVDMDAVNRFPAALDTFVERTQAFARTRKQLRPLKAPEELNIIELEAKTSSVEGLKAFRRNIMEQLPYFGPRLKRWRSSKKEIRHLRELNLRLSDALKMQERELQMLSKQLRGGTE